MALTVRGVGSTNTNTAGGGGGGGNTVATVTGTYDTGYWYGRVYTMTATGIGTGTITENNCLEVGSVFHFLNSHDFGATRWKVTAVNEFDIEYEPYFPLSGEPQEEPDFITAPSTDVHSIGVVGHTATADGSALVSGSWDEADEATMSALMTMLYAVTCVAEYVDSAGTKTWTLTFDEPGVEFSASEVVLTARGFHPLGNDQAIGPGTTGTYTTLGVDSEPEVPGTPPILFFNDGGATTGTYSFIIAGYGEVTVDIEDLDYDTQITTQLDTLLTGFAPWFAAGGGFYQGNLNGDLSSASISEGSNLTDGSPSAAWSDTGTDDIPEVPGEPWEYHVLIENGCHGFLGVAPLQDNAILKVGVGIYSQRVWIGGSFNNSDNSAWVQSVLDSLPANVTVSVSDAGSGVNVDFTSTGDGEVADDSTIIDLSGIQNISPVSDFFVSVE
jgi:hypothetical protein